jgi:hypothetical protein
MVSIAFLNQAVESLHSFRSYSLQRQLFDTEKMDIMRYIQDLTRLEHSNIPSDQVESLAGRVSVVSTEDIDKVYKAYAKARLFMLIPESIELDKREGCIDYFLPLIEGIHDLEQIMYLFTVFNILEKTELQSICSLAAPIVSSISDPLLRGQVVFSIAKIGVDDREAVCREVSCFCQEAIDFTGISSLIDLFAKFPNNMRKKIAKICFPYCCFEDRIEAKLSYLQYFISNHSEEDVQNIFSFCEEYLQFTSDCYIDRKQSMKIQMELIDCIREMNPADRNLICPYVKDFCQRRENDDWKNILFLFQSINSIPESYREKVLFESRLYFDRFISIHALIAFLDVFSTASECDIDELMYLAKSYCSLFPSHEENEHSLCRFLQSTFLVDKSHRLKAFNYLTLLKHQGVQIVDECRLFIALGEMQEDDAIHVCALIGQYFSHFTYINAIVRALSNVTKEERETFAKCAASHLAVLPPDEKTCVMLVMMSYFRPALSAQIFDKLTSGNLLPFQVSFRFISEYLKRLIVQNPEFKEEFNTFFAVKWASTSISNAKRGSLALEIIDLCRYMHFEADHPLVVTAIENIVFNQQKIRFTPFVTVFMQNRSLISPMQRALVRWMQSEEDSQKVLKLSLEILDHARFLYSAAALPLLKESFYQVIVKEGYSLSKLLPILGKAPNAAPVFHEVMISLFRNLTDRLLVRSLARQTLSHPLHLAIDQDHEVFQEAVRVMILSDQATDKKNPYILFGFLKSMLVYPTPSVCLPAKAFKNGVVKVNFSGLKDQLKERVPFDEMLLMSNGQRFEAQILSFLSLRFLERVNTLLPTERENVYRCVQEMTGFELRFLCDNLQDPLFIQILNTSSFDRAPMMQAYLHAYIAFIMSLSDERGPQDVLSEREQALLMMSASIQNCPTGKMEGVVLAYHLLPEKYRYGACHHDAELPVVQETKRYLRALVSSLMIRLCSADNAMMKEMTGVPADIKQLAHQSLYVKNLLFSHVGMEHELQFDSNAGVLYDTLVMKSIKEVLHIFSQHLNPSVIIDEVKNQFDRTTDTKKAYLFNGFNEIVSQNIPLSQMWNISDSDGSYQLTDDGVIELLLSCNFFSFNT